MLLQKVATFEEPEENMDSEDRISDIIELIATKILKVLYKTTRIRSYQDRWKLHLTHLKKYIAHYLKKMARTRDGLNNLARPKWYYFEKRRFATQKEIQQRRNGRFKIKKVIPQSKSHSS